MVADPISDFIIQLKNAGAVKRESISLPYSKFKYAVAHKLAKAGYIKAVSKHGKKTKKFVDIELMYTDKGTPRINGVERVSKPSKRVYQGVDKVASVKYGQGAMILSTPKGILTDKEARKENTGGEALFKIW